MDRKTNRAFATKMHLAKNRVARCGQRDSRGFTNESELVPACFLVLRFSRLLYSQQWPAEMSTDVHTHLNDRREKTVATTVIHDHVDLRSMLYTHTHLSVSCVCPCIGERACERVIMNRFLDGSIDRSRSSRPKYKCKQLQGEKIQWFFFVNFN